MANLVIGICIINLIGLSVCNILNNDEEKESPTTISTSLTRTSILTQTPTPSMPTPMPTPSMPTPMPTPCMPSPTTVTPLPCEGYWNDETLWTVYNACDATCSNPNGTQVMLKTLTIIL